MNRLVFCLCFCVLSIPLSAQSAALTFTSPDGAFSFKYSPVLIRCTPQPGQSRWWVPDDECNSQVELCGDIYGSMSTIVCVARPTHEHFAAAFFVAEVQPEECMEHWPNTTCRPIIKQKDCLAGSSGWWPPETPQSKMRGQNARIGSVRAKLFHDIGDSSMGHYQIGNFYRAFYDKKCYELGIQEAGVTSTGFDPEQIEELTKVAKEDDAKYGPLLLQALHSFRFLGTSRP